MNIAHLLSDISNQMSNTIAIYEYKLNGTACITFGELDRRSDQWAAALTHNGIRQGDHVLILHEMSIDLYVFMVALFKIGAVGLFLDPSFGNTYIVKAFQLCKPVAMFTGGAANWLRLAVPELNRIPIRLTTSTLRRIAGSALVSGEVFPLANVAANAPALLTFTSGSTGQPKGIVRTHEFLKRQLDVLKEELSLTSGEVDMTTLPIFLLANIACGVTSVIPGGLRPRKKTYDARPVLRQISALGVSRMSGAPAFFQRLCEQAQREGQTFSGLRKIYTGGGPVFPRLLTSLSQVAPNAHLHTIYGSSECEPICTIPAGEITQVDRQRMNTGSGLLAGRPIACTKVRLLKSFDPQPQWARPDEAGEVIVSGDHVIKSYFKGIGDSETKLTIDGEIWHRTGDAGAFDTDGRLWLLGRWSVGCTDAMGERRLFPFQIESAALSLMPGADRVAFVQYEGKKVLLLQMPLHRRVRLNSRCAHYDTNYVQKMLPWAGIDNVIQVSAIPSDNRHGSKNDYPAIFRLLKQTMRLPA